MKRKVYWIEIFHDDTVKNIAKKRKVTESLIIRELIETLKHVRGLSNKRTKVGKSIEKV